MKLNKIVVIASAILVTLLMGAVALNVLSAPQTLKLKVKWRPVNYTMGNPVPDPWTAEIFFAPLRPLEQIDTTTLKLEGQYTPSGPAYLLSGNPPRLAVPFDGHDVLEAVLLNAPHLAPGEYHILIEVSGNLKPEYGGTAFSGEGGINLIVPDNSPP